MNLSHAHRTIDHSEATEQCDVGRICVYNIYLWHMVCGLAVVLLSYKHIQTQLTSRALKPRISWTYNNNLESLEHSCIMLHVIWFRLRLLSYSMTRMTLCTADSFEVACEVSPWTEWKGCTEAFWCIKHVMETNDEIKGKFQCTEMESWPEI